MYTVAVPASLADALDLRQLQAVPDADIALAVDVSAVWEMKLAAIRCHATQLAASPMMRAPEDRQRRFFGTEHFVCAAAREGRDDFLPDVLKGYLPCARLSGMGVFQSLTQAGIQPVITGTKVVDKAVAAYLAGTLTNHIERLH